MIYRKKFLHYRMAAVLGLFNSPESVIMLSAIVEE